MKKTTETIKNEYGTTLITKEAFPISGNMTEVKAVFIRVGATRCEVAVSLDGKNLEMVTVYTVSGDDVTGTLSTLANKAATAAKTRKIDFRLEGRDHWKMGNIVYPYSGKVVQKWETLWTGGQL